jgi:hypothetical protein
MPVGFGGTLPMNVGFGRHFYRNGDKPAVAHPALGDETTGIVPYVRSLAPKYGHFHAALMVQMHIQRREY